jgi:RNA polymerase sigma factor (sigma-70 family)
MADDDTTTGVMPVDQASDERVRLEVAPFQGEVRRFFFFRTGARDAHPLFEELYRRLQSAVLDVDLVGAVFREAHEVSQGYLQQHNGAVAFEAPTLSAQEASLLDTCRKRAVDQLQAAHLHANEELHSLADLVEKMPKRDRRIFTLRKVYGMEQAQIAAKLGIPAHAVESSLIRSARFCAKKLFPGPPAKSLLFRVRAVRVMIRRRRRRSH